MGYKNDKPHSEYASSALQKLFDDFGEERLLSASDNYSIDKVFPFSNENLPRMFQDFNFEGKSVLTVGSSGDQMFESILKGAKRVTVADANEYAQPYIELKIAILKNLPYEKAYEYFTQDLILDWALYSKISHVLSPKSKEFWDTIMLESELDDDTRRKIISKIFHGNFMTKGKGIVSFFRSREVYNALKEKINNCEIDFVTADITEFESSVNEKYDFIFLSNIFDYFKDKEFFKCIDGLGRNRLKRDGIMQVNYVFDKTYLDNTMFETMLKKIYNVNDVEKYLIKKHVRGVVDYHLLDFAPWAQGLFLKKKFFDNHTLHAENDDAIFDAVIDKFLNEDWAQISGVEDWSLYE